MNTTTSISANLAKPAIAAFAWDRLSAPTSEPLFNLTLNELREASSNIKLQDETSTQLLRSSLLSITEALEAVTSFIDSYASYKADTSNSRRMPITNFMAIKSQSFNRAAIAFEKINLDNLDLDEKVIQLISLAIKRGKTAADLIKRFYTNEAERDRAIEISERSLNSCCRLCTELCQIFKSHEAKI